MKESPRTPDSGSAERLETSISELLEINERHLDSAKAARQYFTEALTLLEERVPHDDVKTDSTTLSFHVERNVLLSRINELCEDIDLFETWLERLREMQRKAMN